MARAAVFVVDDSGAEPMPERSAFLAEPLKKAHRPLINADERG
jgi:hypothetical protein